MSGPGPGALGGVRRSGTGHSGAGHLAAFRVRPRAEPLRLFTFRLFADRAAAELERLRDEVRIQKSEERYRAFIARNADAMWANDSVVPRPARLSRHFARWGSWG